MHKVLCVIKDVLQNTIPKSSFIFIFITKLGFLLLRLLLLLSHRVDWNTATHSGDVLRFLDDEEKKAGNNLSRTNQRVGVFSGSLLFRDFIPI